MSTLRLRDKALNGTYRFRFTLKKDCIAWANIDSAIVFFEKPDRTTVLEKNLTAEDVATGIWYYDTVDGDLDTAGYWTLTVQATDGSIVIKYPDEVSFRVTE